MIRFPDGNGDGGLARRILAELESRVARRLPHWTARGPEDPARVILEAFALSLADLREELEGLPERLIADLLADLGEEARWPEPARSAVRLLPRDDLKMAVRVPAGTGVTAERSSGGERVVFETRRDAWVSPARLRRALVVEGDRLTELPVAGPGEEVDERARAVCLFSRPSIDRHIYFGDVAWESLRRRADEVVLEWQGIPSFVLEGRWEYSVGGGWRPLPVDCEETVDSSGERVMRMRVFGPLPDLAARELNGAEFPWIRLALHASKRLQWAAPLVAWIPDTGERPADAVARAPRALARVFSRGGERWEDHSFASTKKVTAARPAERGQAAVYLGWDHPLPASLYYQAGGPPPPPDREAPRLIWEYSTKSSFLRLEALDDTGSFSRSGTFGWGLLEGWGPQTLFGKRLYWVRARWVEGDYYDVPRWRCVHPGAVEVIEGRTVRNHRLRLSFPDGGGPRALLPSPGPGEVERFGVIELETTGGDWRRLEHAPGGAIPEREQFRLLRGPRGSVGVEFGESLSGAVEARLPAVRSSLGLGRPRGGPRLDVLEAEVEGLLELREVVPRHPSTAAETFEDLRRRVRAEWAAGFRAVVPEDFRRLLKALDPGLARVSVVISKRRPAELLVVVFASPPCEPGRISPARLEYLERYLRDRVPLGTVVRVVEPAYVACRVEVSPEKLAGESVRRLEDELRAFLEPLAGGDEGDGYPLGRPLQAGDVQSIIDRLSGRGEDPAADEIEESTAREGESGGGIRVSSAADLPGDGGPSGVFLPDALPLLEAVRVSAVDDGGEDP